MRKYIILLARIVSVLLVLWWTFFVFASHGFSKVMLIEMIVPLAVLFVALIAWKWPVIGGLLFFLIGGVYINIAWGRATIPAYLVFSGPMFLDGLLFIIGGSKWR